MLITTQPSTTHHFSMISWFSGWWLWYPSPKICQSHPRQSSLLYGWNKKQHYTHIIHILSHITQRILYTYHTHIIHISYTYWKPPTSHDVPKDIPTSHGWFIFLITTPRALSSEALSLLVSSSGRQSRRNSTVEFKKELLKEIEKWNQLL